MYVGLCEPLVGVTGPQDIRFKEAKRCLDILDRYLALSEFISSTKWDEEELGCYKRIVKEQYIFDGCDIPKGTYIKNVFCK